MSNQSSNDHSDLLENTVRGLLVLACRDWDSDGRLTEKLAALSDGRLCVTSRVFFKDGHVELEIQNDHSRASPKGGVQLLLSAGATTGAKAETLLAQALEGINDRDENPLRLLGLDRASRVRARDAALRKAADLVSPKSKSPWIQAGALEAAIKRFSCTLWPRIKAGVDVGPLGPSDAELGLAFRACGKVPKTQRHLYNMLK